MKTGYQNPKGITVGKNYNRYLLRREEGKCSYRPQTRGSERDSEFPKATQLVGNPGLSGSQVSVITLCFRGSNAHSSPRTCSLHFPHQWLLPTHGLRCDLLPGLLAPGLPFTWIPGGSSEHPSDPIPVLLETSMAPNSPHYAYTAGPPAPSLQSTLYAPPTVKMTHCSPNMPENLDFSLQHISSFELECPSLCFPLALCVPWDSAQKSPLQGRLLGPSTLPGVSSVHPYAHYSLRCGTYHLAL